MIGARQIVEFVTEVAVTAAGIEVQQQFDGGNGRHHGTGALNPRHSALVGGHGCCFLNPSPAF
jgi:hypothetical protein